MGDDWASTSCVSGDDSADVVDNWLNEQGDLPASNDAAIADAAYDNSSEWDTEYYPAPPKPSALNKATWRQPITKKSSSVFLEVVTSFPSLWVQSKNILIVWGTVSNSRGQCHPASGVDHART
jgi:hypothetical protein